MAGCVWGCYNTDQPWSWLILHHFHGSPLHVTELSPATQTPDSQNSSHEQKTPTKPVRVLPSANILQVPFHILFFHDHGEGIHTHKPHWKGIYSKTSHLDQAEQNLLWITPRTKQSYTKRVKNPWILNHKKYQHTYSVHTPISNSPSLQRIESTHKHKSTPPPHDWRLALHQQGCRCLLLLIHKSSAEAN